MQTFSGKELTFSTVEAHQASTKVIGDIIRETFKAEGPADLADPESEVVRDAAWRACADYLWANGVMGKADWDHCKVVEVLLAYDALRGGTLKTYMGENKLRASQMWRYVNSALRKAGFEMQNGYIQSIRIEDKSEAA